MCIASTVSACFIKAQVFLWIGAVGLMILHDMFHEGKTIFSVRGRFEVFVENRNGETAIVIRQDGGKTLRMSFSDFRILTGNFKLVTMCIVDSIPEEFEIYGEQCKFAMMPYGTMLCRLLKIVIESVEQELKSSLQSINISFANGFMVLGNKADEEKEEEEFRFQETDYRMLYGLRKEINNQVFKFEGLKVSDTKKKKQGSQDKKRE